MRQSGQPFLVARRPSYFGGEEAKAGADTIGGHYYDGWPAALAGGRLRAVSSRPARLGGPH